MQGSVAASTPSSQSPGEYNLRRRKGRGGEKTGRFVNPPQRGTQERRHHTRGILPHLEAGEDSPESSFPERSSCLSDERLPRAEGIVPMQWPQFVTGQVRSIWPHRLASKIAFRLSDGRCAALVVDCQPWARLTDVRAMLFGEVRERLSRISSHA